jgi:glutathione S-transferase
MPVVLYGYRYSVYVRIAQVVLAEKQVTYDRIEVNPFASDMPTDYLKLHPFRRVPTLVHDTFTLYETGAITRFIDEAFPGPLLQPLVPVVRARMTQIISIVDAYGYLPMVRQVFSQRVFGPRLGRTADEHQVRVGLEGASRVLGALEAIVSEKGSLVGEHWSLADCHLAPMIGYFTAAPEGQALLAQHPKLAAWWAVACQRPSLVETDPGLPDESAG